MIVKLLGYMPDADQTIIGVITNASGIVPTLKGVRGAPSPADTPLASLAGTCMGAAVLAELDGSTRFIAGTNQKLYEAGNSTWSDVSRAATYTTAATGRWTFAQQSSVSFAANGADTIQASVSGAFSCIAGAPIASIVETVGKFVFGVNLSTDVQGIKWSALNDYTSWSASINTQAGSDSLNATPGPITAAKRFGNTIVVYKKSSMFLGINAGPPTVWEFPLIPGEAGALSQGAVANIGTPENPVHIFMGQDDFYRYDGSRPVPIGTNDIKATVFNALVQSRSHAAQTLHDRKNSRVYFYYPTTDSNVPSSCVVYNYRTGRWGIDDRPVQATVEYIAPAISYDQLGAIYSTYDDLPTLSYDSAFVGATVAQPAVFNTSNLVKTLTGPAGATSVTTGDYGDPQSVNTVTRIVPIFLQAPTTATLTNFYKMRTGDALTTDATTSISSGAFDFIREARWHRLQFNMTGDWEMAGFSPEFEGGGSE